MKRSEVEEVAKFVEGPEIVEVVKFAESVKFEDVEFAEIMKYVKVS